MRKQLTITKKAVDGSWATGARRRATRVSSVVALALGALLAATWFGGSASLADDTCDPNGLQRQELSDWV